MKRKYLVWIFLGVLSLALRLFLSPQLIEQGYSRGLFRVVRWGIDYLLAGWVPFVLLYLFVAGLVLWLFYRWRRYPLKRPVHWLQFLKRSFYRLLAVVGALIFFFLILWGYNYGRVPIEQQLQLSPSPLSVVELRTMMEEEADALPALRELIPAAGDSAIQRQQLPEELEAEIRRELSAWLQANAYPTFGRPRVKPIYPQGIFLRFSSSGLYFPYTGEGSYDAGLHPLQLPHVIAHEMSHAYGFADEGSCNFLAYLSGHAAADPAIAYATRLDFYRTLASNYLRYEPEAYREFRAGLPVGIQADLDAINDNLRAYPDIMPRVRYVAYDTYLRAQGIREGMRNYSRVIMLVRAWREQQE